MKQFKSNKHLLVWRVLKSDAGYLIRVTILDHGKIYLQSMTLSEHATLSKQIL